MEQIDFYFKNNSFLDKNGKGERVIDRPHVVGNEVNDLSTGIAATATSSLTVMTPFLEG